MHFYKLFELKCVLALGSVCTQPPYNYKSPPSVFFYLLKSIPLSQIPLPLSRANLRYLSVWCHMDKGRSHYSLIDSSILAQTALVCYLRPTPWVSCHQLFYHRSRCIQECLRLHCQKKIWSFAHIWHIGIWCKHKNQHEIWFFRIQSEPFTNVVLNQIHIRYLDIRPTSKWMLQPEEIPPYYVKHFEWLEKCYINVTNYYN